MSAPGAAQCQHLQALDDALAFRHARVATPCADCTAAPGGWCEDHGRDVDLISEYRRTAAQLMDGEPHPLSTDTRVAAARELLAEHHQPAAMPPGELRALATRYQKQLHALLDAASGGDPEAGSMTGGRFGTGRQARPGRWEGDL